MIVSILQSEVSDDRKQNEKEILRRLDQAAAQGADLVLLPELWNTPFINSVILEHSQEWAFWMTLLCQQARKLKLWIVAGTLPCQEENRLYNRCALISDHGELIACTDKTHLLEVHSARHDYYEADVFTPGNRLCKADTPWGRIAVLICYDNRFPEAARSLCQDCFALFAPCGFNEAVGRKHWKPLFQTRAMENEVFVFAANPARKEYGSYTSYGHSMAVSPDGLLLGELGDEPGVLSVEINPEEVSAVRFRSPFWALRRTDLYSPGQNAAQKADDEKDHPGKAPAA